MKTHKSHLEEQVLLIKAFLPLFQIVYMHPTYTALATQKLEKKERLRIKRRLAELLKKALINIDNLSVSETMLVLVNVRALVVPMYEDSYNEIKRIAERYTDIKQVRDIFEQINKNIAQYRAK